MQQLSQDCDKKITRLINQSILLLSKHQHLGNQLSGNTIGQVIGTYNITSRWKTPVFIKIIHFPVQVSAAMDIFMVIA